MLKPIEYLKFYEQWHRYRYKESWLARSVTQILSFDLTEEAKHWINVTSERLEALKQLAVRVVGHTADLTDRLLLFRASV